MKKTVLYLSAITLMVFTASCSGKDAKNNSANLAENNSTEIQAADEDVKVGLNIGDQAPNMEYPSPEGKMISLKSLRGKVVLIDFWAAWCPPCRMENPNLVSTYAQYKDKDFQNGDGFTIYSVSLDQSKDSWVKAIKDDKLSWENHVSDLKYWQSEPAAMYQVRGIPMNYLINGDGIIVAKNLRGEALGAALNSMVK